MTGSGPGLLFIHPPASARLSSGSKGCGVGTLWRLNADSIGQKLSVRTQSGVGKARCGVGT
jgi:hypothetical protein